MADEEKIVEQRPGEITNPVAPATEEDLASSALLTDETVPLIPDEKIAEWKEKYGQVFVIFHLGRPYVYRTFDYQEYKNLRNDVFKLINDSAEAQQKIPDDVFKEECLKRFVLWPENMEALMSQPEKYKLPDGAKLPGGIPHILGEYIMASAGFTETEPQIIE